MPAVAMKNGPSVLKKMLAETTSGDKQKIRTASAAAALPQPRLAGRGGPARGQINEPAANAAASQCYKPRYDRVKTKSSDEWERE